MGIKGLRNALSQNQVRQAHISELAGKKVVCDGFAWLHKGAFGCAMQLALGQPTERYVEYCMHLARLLRHNKVTPIIVLDGASLPSKARTSDERTARRRENLEKGKMLLQYGDTAQAERHFQAAVTVTGS